MQYQPAIFTFGLNLRPRQIAGDLQDPLEAAVGYFELMIAPPLGDHGVPPDSAHYQLVLRDQHLYILQFDAGKIELEDVQRSEEHTSELQSLRHLVCRLLLEKKKKIR